jgi:hypothetical protein
MSPSSSIIESGLKMREEHVLFAKHLGKVKLADFHSRREVTVMRLLPVCGSVHEPDPRRPQSHSEK